MNQYSMHITSWTFYYQSTIIYMYKKYHFASHLRLCAMYIFGEMCDFSLILINCPVFLCDWFSLFYWAQENRWNTFSLESYWFHDVCSSPTIDSKLIGSISLSKFFLNLFVRNNALHPFYGHSCEINTNINTTSTIPQKTLFIIVKFAAAAFKSDRILNSNSVSSKSNHMHQNIYISIAWLMIFKLVPCSSFRMDNVENKT